MNLSVQRPMRPVAGRPAATRRPGLVVVLASLIAAGTASAQDPQAPRAAGLEATGNPLFDATVERYLKHQAPKIVGGKLAAPGAYPWQVSLGAAAVTDPVRAHFCGGSIVNRYWVRTAAHCVRGLTPDRISVAAGVNRLAPGTVRTPVAAILIHRDYDRPEPHDNDLALLKLVRPLSLGAGTQAIELAKPGDALTPGQVLEVSGWGATAQGGAAVPDLRVVEVPYVSNKKCNDPLSYAGRVTPNMLCAGKPQGGKDSCQGDSGGPLVDRTRSPAVQVGIVSWGEGCARPGKYGVYADARRYAAWEERCVSRPQDCD